MHKLGQSDNYVAKCRSYSYGFFLRDQTPVLNVVYKFRANGIAMQDTA